MKKPKNRKWYENKTLLIFLLFFLYPIGLVGICLRKTKNYKKLIAFIPLILWLLLISVDENTQQKYKEEKQNTSEIKQEKKPKNLPIKKEPQKPKFDIGLSEETLKDFKIDTIHLDTLNGTYKSKEIIVRGITYITSKKFNVRREENSSYLRYYIDPSFKNELDFVIFDRFDSLDDKDIISVTYQSKYGDIKFGCGRCGDVKETDDYYALKKNLKLSEIDQLENVSKADSIYVLYEQRILSGSFMRLMKKKERKGLVNTIKLHKQIRILHEKKLRKIE